MNVTSPGHRPASASVPPAGADGSAQAPGQRRFAIDFAHAKLLSADAVAGTVNADGELTRFTPEQRTAFEADFRQQQAAALEKVMADMQRRGAQHSPGYAWFQGMLQTLRP